MHNNRNHSALFWYPAVAFALVACIFMAGCNPGEDSKDAEAARDGGGQKPDAALYKLALGFDGSETPAGKFEELASVAAGAGNVYVADRAYSAIYVFDERGKFQSSIGCGFKIDDYALGNDELALSNATMVDPSSEALRHEIALHRFFRPEDLEFASGHIFVLNSFFSSLVPEPVAVPEVIEFTSTGQFYRNKKLHMAIRPGYLAVDGSSNYALTDQEVDEFYTADSNGNDVYINKKSMVGFRGYYLKLLDAGDDTRAIESVRALLSNTGAARFQFRGIGGLAIFTPVIDGEPSPGENKLLVCDSGNNRIKVLTYKGELLKIIDGISGKKKLFSRPIDISILDGGRLAVLVADPPSVVLLASNFEILGRFGDGDLVEPRTIFADYSGDIWIADRGAAKVFRYTPADRGS
ncbi:MAG: hypothetical protein HRF49_09440 [bacterium]|jgi:hypothetical protein